MADLRNIGLKNERMTFKRTYLLNLPVSSRAEPCHSLHYPSPPRKFFALPAMNGSLPAELKFRENTQF